jgi:hypothetical protein
MTIWAACPPAASYPVKNRRVRSQASWLAASRAGWGTDWSWKALTITPAFTPFDCT